MTGPEYLRGRNLRSAGGSSRIVGSSVVSECRVSPSTSCAPPAFASSIQEATRSASLGRISGPTSVSSWVGSPTLSDSTRAANRSTNCARDIGVDEDALGRNADLTGMVIPTLGERAP